MRFMMIIHQLGICNQCDDQLGICNQSDDHHQLGICNQCENPFYYDKCNICKGMIPEGGSRKTR